MMVLRRYRGIEGAKEYVDRAGDPNASLVPKTDGGGYYECRMDPDEFATRVINDVNQHGDRVVRALTAAIDGVELEHFEVPSSAIDDAVRAVGREEREAMKIAADRVEAFQQRNLPKSWFDDERGYGEVVRPIETVGCYVPGGSAPLASTVIMTAVPAVAAGVSNVIVATPPASDGLPHPAILAACNVSGVHRVFAIGGALAIAALAVGTQTVPRVNLICGPGNVWVTAAKLAAFGQVGIEGVYGPTETMVVVDESSSPELAAADLIAQAEHDVMARPVLVALTERIASAVEDYLREQLAKLPRTAIANAAFERNGAVIIVENIDNAVAVANMLAPEHLCIATQNAAQLIRQVKNAGGVFAGEWSAEVMADYVAGPSHVMPTSGSAKWSSTLSARDFVRVMPVVNFTKQQFLDLSSEAATLARMETLDGHAEASMLRRRRALGE